MRQNYIKFIVIIGYMILVGLAIFGIVYIYRELVKYSETNRLPEQQKELVIITNTLTALYQAEGTMGLLTIATEPALKQEYDSLMNTVFYQIEALKKVSSEEDLIVRVDSLNTLLLLKKENTEQLVQLMNNFETQTVREMTHTTVLSQKDIDALNRLLEKNKTELFEDTTKIIAEKKGFFRRIRDVLKSDPDTLIQVSSHSHTNLEDMVVPSITDTIIDFIRDVNISSQRRNTAGFRQVIRRQNELYRMNETMIAHINKIVDEIELREYKNRLKLMEEREDTLKRSSDVVSFIAYAALIVAIIFMSWIIYYITAGQRLQREIEKAKKVVDNLLISREQLLLTITHDIKAPISSIIGYLELMKKDKLPKKAGYYIENMQQSSVHILNLVKDLLDFYSLDHDQQKINSLPFSPRMLVSQIFESFIPEADKKELRFEMNMNIRNNENYVSDPYRIRQILNNLLSNAIKYTPDAGRVLLSASIEQNTLILSVKDTGPGIKDADKSKIFEEFRRLEYTGVGIEGVGLGLNITNKLSRLLGGAVEIDSTFGKGSVFTVRLPLQPNFSGNEEKMLPPEEKKTEETGVDKNIKILFIDDDIIQLNLLTELMKREGIVPYVCPNALEALQLIQKEQFDIIFSDIQMAGMNGFELVDRIRSITFNSSATIPIIGLSAHSNISESKFKEAGFTSFLSKPFTSEQLFNVIKSQTSLTPENKEFYTFDNEGFAAIAQFAGNDRSAVKTIIDSFVCENNKNLEILENAFEKEDWKTVAGVSHKMISLMRMISAQKLVALLQEYENGSKSKENKLPLLKLIREKIAEAEKFIDNET